MAEPVRVVHLIGRLSSGGGVQQVVLRLAHDLDPHQVDLHAVTMRPAWDELSDVPLTLHTSDWSGAGFRLRDRVRILWRMTRTTRRLRPDVVQVHSGIAWIGLGARVVLPRVPFILEVHDAPGSGRHGAGTDRLEAALVRWFGFVPVCHSVEVEEAVSQAAGIPPAEVVRFPLGVDTDRFAPASPEDRDRWRTAHGIGADAVVAVAIGRPAPSKRFDLAIRLVHQARTAVPNLHLLVVGAARSTELAAEVRRLDASASVTLLPNTYGDELTALITSCDILVSASSYEGFGLTLIEGMASGLPVIASAVGGVFDIVIPDVTGYLVDLDDDDGFVARLEELGSSAVLRRDLGTAGRDRVVAAFSQAATTRAFTDLYRRLAGRS